MTITRTGKPGRMVSVGWMLSWRRTICWPVWLMLSCAPLRIAWTRSVVVVWSASFGADAEQRREAGRLDQIPQ